MARRRSRIAVIAVATLAAAGAAGWALTRPDSGVAAAPAPAPLPTVKVTKQDLVETQEVDGTLGYGEQHAVPGQQGTVTWLAPVGSVVSRGQTLYKVDQRPVSLLYGVVPMYRTLQDGVEGADVQQLEENLRKLGYTGFTVDDEYTGATAEAVEEWQEDLGREETGKVQRGDVVFTATAVRVASHGSVVGGPAGGTVLSYTGTTRLVTVPLPVGDQQLAVKGAKVGVELPSGGTTPGTIESVSTVAKAAPQSEGAGQPEANVEDATVDVIVRLDKPAAAGTLDEAPASVHFTAEQRKGVLTVPVTALLALAEGGYGVQVVAEGNSKVVAVKVGLFANGRVEISGAGISAGAMVEVPQT
ncbi:peptidoglycan-binding domain-containing protein [Kribbella sp. HUAS MG21]|uniref:Peptidoglycan-binding domain-containing protein n=1 Tax=Kribbella sp. HUAS MG21 TaxID=3160966 RepID=A0AAU7T334_9ACTN